MDCPLCGVGLADARPRYRILLKLAHETGPSMVTDDEETVVNQHVCRDCWRDVQRELV